MSENMYKKIIPKDKRFRMVLMFLADIVIVQLSSFLGLWLRYDMGLEPIPEYFMESVRNYAPVHTVTTIIIFYILRLYHIMWGAAGIKEVFRIVSACGLAGLFQIAGMMLLQLRIPRSYALICTIVMICLTVAMRLSYRVYQSLKVAPKNATGKRVMVIGAGESGTVIVKEMENSEHIYGKVVCLIDDDKNKIGKYLYGVPIVGDISVIPAMVEKYNVDEIYVAIPSATALEKKKILEVCRETDCEIKILPGIYQLWNDEVSVSKLREVEIEDLLGRDSVRVNLDEIMDYVSDKVILVTGGGGSIGSELCRQIAGHNPKQLIILDIYENNAYEIQQELKRLHPELDLVVLIGSVRNTNRMNRVFETYRPQIVYHAAAHKHVPLMEDSPNEAIKNNVFGTYKTAKAAIRYGAERFVLISTDKAVNPTNIMGASKRMCEMIVQMLNRESETDFVAVRFGNVLGSNGSVIPLFKKQIAEGGPVTVTHPDIIRYFMTIPEAVSLVLQAGAYAKGGEIFVLDMGEPVKILDLATNLIRLSGYVPNEDIMIEFTGLRPGEKLFEELLMEEEGMQDTPNKLIHIGKPIEFDEAVFKAQLECLESISKQDEDSVKDVVQKIVPTYNPSNEVRT